MSLSAQRRVWKPFQEKGRHTQLQCKRHRGLYWHCYGEPSYTSLTTQPGLTCCSAVSTGEPGLRQGIGIAPKAAAPTTTAPALNILMNKGAKPGLSLLDEVRQLMQTSLKLQRGFTRLPSRTNNWRAKNKFQKDYISPKESIRCIMDCHRQRHKAKSLKRDLGSSVILSVTNQQFLGKILEITVASQNLNKTLDSGKITLAALDIKLYRNVAEIPSIMNQMQNLEDKRQVARERKAKPPN